MKPAKFKTPGDISALAEAVSKSTAAEKKLCPIGIEGEEAGGNKVIYLHGYGDVQAGMLGLAKSLRLPQVTTMVLQGLGHMPLGMDGRQWYPDSEVESALYGSQEAKKQEKEGRNHARKILLDFLHPALYPPATTFLVGHGQGAELALWLAESRLFAGILLLDVPSYTALPRLLLPPRDLPLHFRDGVGNKLVANKLFSRCCVSTSDSSESLLSVAKWFAGILPLAMKTLENDPDVIKLDNGVF
eukprot:TRINITY_DN17380_c0_g1_i1.p1 TRINITY_DN17380_c0_g1~~TRINITY_DN17380_c0_g1_i1.p1  ORF type:complete len:251 (+),score=37.18 TRINITY_DN17380_c0_g1_i1:23-754(+)